MLRLDSVSHTFNLGQVNQVNALVDIDLFLLPEQFVTVIGSNGAGKSTLFNLIAGVDPPTRGRIIIDDIDVTSWSEPRRAIMVGRVFQNPLMGTASSMTIAENLTLALLRDQKLRLGIGVSQSRKRYFQEILASLDLGLESRLDAPVSQLSGGQRQAMTLLMASLAKPKILLLDEHTAALDPATALKILELTRAIVENHKITTLMITHNMQQALENGDRMLMMDGGQIVLDLSAKEKAGMSVQDLVNQFTSVRHESLVDDELLLVG